MKVIAIKDAPVPDTKFLVAGIPLDRAYSRGDIFEVVEGDKFHLGRDRLLIWHPKLGGEMDVNSNNFITLQEFRNRKIEELGI